MSTNPDRLYELLPVVYRERDADQGYQLRALMRIITAQSDLLRRDVQTLWNDLFIETCRTWVIPYIGDLVGNRLLFDAGRLGKIDATALDLFRDLTGPDLKPPIAVRTRTDVAKTIYYRRRKGTIAMLEELARDVTGWPAHAVEFFELLGWNQFREHYRPQSHWADVRNVDRMDRVNGPFDETSHTVDVRAIAQREGWHNIPNVGFFLYRLQSYLLRNVPAREAGAPGRYHFSPLGNPAPLFSRWRREGNPTALATELDVPAPIRRPFFYEDLQRYRNLAAPPARPDFTDLYGLPDPIPGDPTGINPESSFFIRVNGASVPPAQDPNAPPEVFPPEIVCRQLDPWPAAQPVGRMIAVDVQTGRMAIGDGFGAIDSVDVYYHYGFSSDLGGGPYERTKWLVRPDLVATRLFVLDGVPLGAIPNTFPTVTDALNEWVTIARPNAVISILDSRTYALPGVIQVPNEGALAIEAAGGQRPVLQTVAAGLEIQTLPPAVAGDSGRSAALTLGGVVVEGHLHVTGDLGRLRLLHATLVPGRSLTEDGAPGTVLPSIVVDAGPDDAPLNAQLQIQCAFSILGAVECPVHAEGVWLLDSILDALSDAGNALAGTGGAAGPPLTGERSTVFGQLNIRQLSLSESIVTGHVETVRTQEGCVRFSWVPDGSRTPRRFRCQPDLAVDAAIEDALARNPALTLAERTQVTNFVLGYLRPGFSAVRYGRPEYAQLRLSSPLEIRTGAEDGSEMGAFSHVKQPQRESNLRIRLDEYLPFGLQAGILYVT